VRIYLPPDANCLLAVADHCLRSRNTVNVIVAGGHAAPQYLDIESAAEHCRKGLGRWKWASNETGSKPDVVLACAGEIPTMETLAAADLLMEYVPGLRFRVVNVVDLFALQSPSHHAHGLLDEEFDAMFTRDRPVIFAFHGYPKLIHALTHRRANHAAFHVHGYKDEEAATTPFDMAVLNHVDRYHLALDAVKWAAEKPARERFQKIMEEMLARHHSYVVQNGQDMPEIRDWKWRNPILEHADERVEEASEESFPASDAPASWSGIESNR
jgi:xylulose-5-phosphate/fructose-6-phosphate phosphoketolase